MGKTTTQHLIVFGFTCLLLLVNRCYSRRDMLVKGQRITGDGGLVSQDGIFKLGFFGFEFSESMTHHYLRIYYAGVPGGRRGVTDKGFSVWIGNRDNPVINHTPTLTIDDHGSFMILQGGGNPIVLYSAQTSWNTTAVLENSGNLVLQETYSDGSTRVLWRSFDHPTDTLLPGMKLGMNFKTGENWSLSSWRSEESPARGSFTLGLDPIARDQLVIWQKGDVYWRSGPWKGAVDRLSKESSYTFNYVSNKNEVYFDYSVDVAVTIFPLLILGSEGSLEEERGVRLADCLLSPVILGHGCAERRLPKCRRPEDVYRFVSRTGFMSVGGFKFKESDNMSLADCRDNCLRNCSCVAYSSTNVDGTGCEIWSSTVSFIRASFVRSAEGRTIIILEPEEKTWWLWLVIAIGGMLVIVSLVSMIWAICLKSQENDGIWNQKMILRELGSAVSTFSKKKAKDQERDRNELSIFSFEDIAAATDYFSNAKTLGEGGYGPVYKGRLPDGQEIAVKRLSRSSGQGLLEFKNEAVLIAKLQHTNLVRLLGFCVQGEEKILIYEYMANKSLDFFIFDSSRRSILNWRRRFVIIEGIAQGLLYLHKYSRLRVIHRDLKASNILLDGELNPKISDFGLARIFGVHETEANTNRVVGTYGYMSPEYAFQGIVSMKTDVFSFGVLLLEIVRGKKNTSLYHSEHPLNLIGYAWQLWNDGRALELMDPALDSESCPHNEILRCIHVGLLCVQDNAADRPDMLDVVSMLSHVSIPVPAPKQPAFFFSAVREESDASEKKKETCSVNQVSITTMEAR